MRFSIEFLEHVSDTTQLVNGRELRVQLDPGFRGWRVRGLHLAVRDCTGNVDTGGRLRGIRQ